MYKKSSHSGSSYGSRPPFRGGPSSSNPRGPRRFSTGGNRTRNRGPQGENISHARFINKATITEEVEHFVQ